jgi:hypothetical protein
MPEPRRERIARNESAFRALNDSLQASIHRDRGDSDFAGFVCECGDAECEVTVRLDLPTYESVRRDPQQFIVVPGHEVPDAEDVVDGGEGYAIVRKHLDVADLVDDTHPRRDA